MSEGIREAQFGEGLAHHVGGCDRVAALGRSLRVVELEFIADQGLLPVENGLATDEDFS
jgi:hypothetical protein